MGCVPSQPRHRARLAPPKPPKQTAQTASIERRLAEATLFNTPAFLPDFRIGRVLRVYDGDTITVATCVDDRIVKVNIRLRGIDAPEIHAKSQTERDMAEAARQELANLALGRTVVITSVANDKYGGRYVADVCVVPEAKDVLDGRDCAQHMLASGLARPYDGKRAKAPWPAE
jgi:micrococcal nuclease